MHLLIVFFLYQLKISMLKTVNARIRIMAENIIQYFNNNNVYMLHVPFTKNMIDVDGDIFLGGNKYQCKLKIKL